MVGNDLQHARSAEALERFRAAMLLADLRLAALPATAEVIDRFRAALAARGIVPPESVIADGSIHRCDAAGRNGKGDAAYLLHLDGIPAGGLENWRDGKGWESWCFDLGRTDPLTPERKPMKMGSHITGLR